jgi:hypothetical protein
MFNFNFPFLHMYIFLFSLMQDENTIDTKVLDKAKQNSNKWILSLVLSYIRQYTDNFPFSSCKGEYKKNSQQLLRKWSN